MADSAENVSSIEENNDESIITMVDVLEDQNKIEQEAFAVLGASDDMNCTYDLGYMKRQALYACKTCSSEKPAGICLACSYHCHEGHDLIELYTKRNVRCDCGNSLFGERKCNLQPIKDSVNIANDYNQNYKGLYCTCSRPYPDPEDDTPDEMIQCIICEDWFHLRHLNLPSVPNSDNYSEMMCYNCSDRLSFLLNRYRGFSVTLLKKESTNDNDEKIEVDDENDVKPESKSVIEIASSDGVVNNVVGNGLNSTDIELKKAQNGFGNNDVKMETTLINGMSTEINSKTNFSPSTSGASTSSTDDVISSLKRKRYDCKLENLKEIPAETKCATFWKEGFRNELCRCDSCLDLYKINCIRYIIDEDDTVQSYEEKGELNRNKNSTGSDYEEGLKALSTLDRVKQVEAIHSYNELQQNLKEYLRKFAADKKVVRAEDIKEFFSNMQSKKRLKIDMPYYCH